MATTQTQVFVLCLKALKKASEMEKSKMLRQFTAKAVSLPILWMAYSNLVTHVLHQYVPIMSHYHVEERKW